MRPGQALRRSWLGAGVSSGLLLLGRRGQRRVWRRRLLRRLIGRLGELHCPGALLCGVDFEKAGPVIAAREAVLDALDGEFLIARAHESLARPFAAAIVVNRMNIVIPRDQLALHERLTAARRQIPPALGGP